MGKIGRAAKVGWEQRMSTFDDPVFLVDGLLSTPFGPPANSLLCVSVVRFLHKPPGPATFRSEVSISAA